MDTVESAAQSATAAFDKGFNVEAVGSSVVASEVSSPQPVASKVASSAATAAVTQVESLASSQVESAIETEAGSETGSMASSASSSEINYKQKWKSLDGIVKTKDARISVAESTNASLLSERRAPAASALALSAETSAVDELVSLYEQHAEAIVEGQAKDAAKLQMKIDSIKEQRMDVRLGRQVATVATATLTAKEDEAAFNAVVSNTWRDIPYLDHTADGANDRAIKFVQVVAADYVQNGGMSRSQALASAVSEAAAIFGSAAVTSAESSIVGNPESSANESTLKGMAVVKSKGGPIKTDQKDKGGGTFEAGFAGALK